MFENTSNTMTFAESNDGGSWKTCDPKSELKSFAERNASANHNLKAVCRMMRIWKDYCSVAISGMLIDTLAYNFIDTWPHKDKSYLYYDYLVRDFMEYLKTRDKTQDWWRAPGSNSWVRRTGSFEAKAATAYQNAIDAISYESNKQNWSAKQAWQRIFGTIFSYD